MGTATQNRPPRTKGYRTKLGTPHYPGVLDYILDISGYWGSLYTLVYIYFFRTLLLSSSSGQAVVTGRYCPFSPPVLAFNFYRAYIGFSNLTAPRFFIECLLLTHALAFSASQFVHKEKSQRIYTSMHSGGFEPTKLT